MNGQVTLQRPYNSRIIDIYMKLIKKRYSHVDVDELLRHADMEPYQIADQGHWFSQEQVDTFYEKLVELSGNPFIAREAGHILIQECVIVFTEPEAHALIDRI